MTLDLSKMGFGITSSVNLDIVRELAPRVEAAGFRTLWINHAGQGEALASMRVAASVTTTLRLASGVIPVDRVSADEIINSVRKDQLPLDRIVIGIGASAKPSPLTSARKAALAIQKELGAKVFVGALGPKMRRLAVRDTDGELLNWLTPDSAREAVKDKEDDLADMPEKSAEVALYIRVALGAPSRPVLEREAARYAAIPAYAANFSRLGFKSLDSAVFGESPEEIRSGLEAFQGVVDEAVVRAITTSDRLDEFTALIDAVSG